MSETTMLGGVRHGNSCASELVVNRCLGVGRRSGAQRSHVLRQRNQSHGVDLVSGWMIVERLS